VTHQLDRHDDALEAGRAGRVEDLVQCRAALGEDLVDGGLDALGPYGLKRRQPAHRV
jgi:hypothetical protein